MADLSTERTSFEARFAELLELLNLDGSSGSGTILDGRLSLINMVKAKLDEVIPEGEGITFSPSANTNVSDPYNLLINAFLDEGTKRVIQLAPLHLLDPVKATGNGVENSNDSNIGHILLPDNFLRFVSLKMADWKRGVSECISESDPRYKLQGSKYTRGGTIKPIACFSFRTDSAAEKRVIEYYSVNASHVIDWLYYIQETVAENLPSRLTDALTYQVAGMVLQAAERTDLAEKCYEQVMLTFQNL